ncbi:MAG: hypothetical protein ACK46R_12275 [Bacteroidota bacterium]|jgi:hypothetical protein
MTPIALFQTIGFNIDEPEFMLGSLSEDDLYGLPYMEMGESYKDTDSIIASNVDRWLKDGYKVFCRIHQKQNQVTLFVNVANELSTQLYGKSSNSQPISDNSSNDLLYAFATAEYIIQKIVFKMEGNWLLRQRNFVNNGLLKYFQYWLVDIQLRENTSAAAFFDTFKTSFAPEINLSPLLQHANEEIGTAFISCFFRGINDVQIFMDVLEKKKQPLHAVHAD